MTCSKCNATTHVRNTYAQTTFDAKAKRDIPVVVRYRECVRCGAIRKTIEVTADVLLRLNQKESAYEETK